MPADGKWRKQKVSNSYSAVILNKIKDAGFDRIVLVATSPAAVSACQKAVESIEPGKSPIIEQITWLDIS